ncbi:hypothetical protein R3P38DRAFT_3464530 [Favolaschia claudopus]|uniref:Uncharacterized protein n=1 Tax=Favolaschia claudopus TaxID=2862362 RepID=A0AAV9ZG24_9AGAR
MHRLRKFLQTGATRLSVKTETLLRLDFRQSSNASSSITADLHRNSIPVLIRVALRVKRWSVHSLISLSASDTAHLHTIPLQSCARHVFWDPSYTLDASKLHTVLSTCTGITNLFLSAGYLHTIHISDLNQLSNLSRLAVDVDALFPAPSKFNFSLPLFRCVTHLELINNDLDKTHPDIAKFLASAPSLTHIAFKIGSGIPALHASLQRSQSRLRCIAFLRATTALRGVEPLAHDDRFVCLQQAKFSADWIRGATESRDHWAVADAFIAAKQTGRIDR